MAALLRSAALLTLLQILVLKRAELMSDEPMSDELMSDEPMSDEPMSDDECSSEDEVDEEGEPSAYDGFVSEETDSFADLSSEGVEREPSSARLKGKQWEGVELPPSQLHRLLPVLCQLKALRGLKELRLVRWWQELAHERDIQAVNAVLPNLDWLFM